MPCTPTTVGNIGKEETTEGVWIDTDRLQVGSHRVILGINPRSVRGWSLRLICSRVDPSRTARVHKHVYSQLTFTPSPAPYNEFTYREIFPLEVDPITVAPSS
jgi:hypothetical protein